MDEIRIIQSNDNGEPPDAVAHFSTTREPCVTIESMPRLRSVTIILLAILLSSCSSQPDSASGGSTPTPLPTTTAPSFLW